MEKKLIFQRVSWLIERADNLRESVANRASFVVSANAILLGALLFADKWKPIANQHLPFLEWLGIFFLLITIILLVISPIFSTLAASGVSFLWKRRTDAYDIKWSDQLFINSIATANKFQKYDDFKKAFLSVSEDEMNNYALGDLWLIQNLHSKRHYRLTLAIRYLLLAIFSFTISSILLIIRISLG